MFFAAITVAQANPGDTTWVQATNRAFDRGNGYGDYDTAVAFPSGALSYRKIYMVFTLGKAACPAGSQYCGDWDYDVHNIIMTPTDTFELGRLITPYANASAPRTPWGWTQRYIFDVTDYYPILKNSAVMRVFYSGYSTGFTGNIRFAFVEGTRERDVLGVSRVWHGGFDYGHGSVPINTALAPLSKTAPAGTQSTELKFIITGHGGDANACAEFCPNTYTMSLNGANFITQNFWKADCGSNQLYPQSGTWIYNRANWCPGEQVQTYSYKLNGITAGNSYTLGITFPPYTSTGGGSQASYKVDGAAIYYGGYNKTTDAGIEDIIAPTDAEYHYRDNPMVGKPIIAVRNSGSATLTSIKFEYGVIGRALQTYTWSGSLASLQTTQITLPELADLKRSAGNYQFVVRVLQANGATDNDATNNEMKSNFVAAPMWPTDIYVQFKNNSQSNGGVTQTKWRIEDMDGNIVAQKNNCGINLLCVDTLSLAFGKAYKLIVTDTNTTDAGYWDIPSNNAVLSPHGDGLRFNGTSGYIRVRRKDNNVQIPMPAEMTSSYEGNFGFGFTHYFYTGWPNAITNVNAAASAELEVFPNPASAQLSVLVGGLKDTKGSVLLVDMVGRTVLERSYTSGVLQVDISTVPGGVYQVIYKNAGQQDIRLTQRLTVTK